MGKHWHFLIRFVLLTAILLTPTGPVTAQQTEQENRDRDRSAKDSRATEADSNLVIIEDATIDLGSFDLPRTRPTTGGNGGDAPSADGQVGPAATGWQTIMVEDGEGVFPADNGWIVGDRNSSNGEDYWGAVSCRSSTGSRSVWAAGNGDMTACSNYDHNMVAWMIYGPFDLSGDVTDAKLTFDLWLDSEAGYDFLWWTASDNGQNFRGVKTSGTAGEWLRKTLSLTDYVGLSSVWIAFIFTSDGSVNGHEGAYLDNIVLSKYVDDRPFEPDINVDPTSMTFTLQKTETQQLRAQSATVDASSLSAIQAQVEANGRLPIIVELKADFTPEGELASAASINDQRYTIQEAQAIVLGSLADQAIDSVKRPQYAPYLALEVDGDALEILAASPWVERIVEDKAVPLALDVSVPLIDADDVWAAGYTGAGQAVAVLDSGVATDHPFLAGKVVAEACFSSNTFEATSLCPNGETSQIGVGAGLNCDPGLDGCEHGTHVAGIAVGSGTLFDGVAPGADIISIQVFSRFADCSDGGLPSPCISAYDSDLMLGLDHVFGLRDTRAIAAANLSLGGGRYTSACDGEPLKAAIDNLRSVGIATVIASGNNSYANAITFPACISTAVSVGATTSQAPADQVASYSNSANFLDLLAPGSDINSSIPGGDFDSWNGTSMATPHVAGTWALLKSRQPDATVDEILAALKSTGVSVLDSRNGLTFPRIDVDAALAAVDHAATLAVENLGRLPLEVTGVSIAESTLASATSDARPHVSASGTQEDCAWLLLSSPAATFTVQPASATVIGVDIDLCVEPGTYVKTIRITSNDPDENPTDVAVTLNVEGNPLAVTLGWFVAERIDGSVDVRWQTTSENGVAGFNLLAAMGEGTSQLNDSLIPSQVVDSIAPTDYRYSATTEATRFHLQVVNIDGTVTDHGPFDLGVVYGVEATAPATELTPSIWLPLIAR